MATTVTIYRLCVDGDMENADDYKAIFQHVKVINNSFKKSNVTLTCNHDKKNE